MSTMTQTMPRVDFSKPRISWDLGELALLSISALGVALISYLLINDISFFSQNRNRQGQEQIALLTQSSSGVKYRSADSLSWERATSKMPLYRKDQIYTDDGTKASVEFKNQTNLEVDENSLVMIDLESDKPSLNLIKGSFTSTTKGNTPNIKVMVNGQQTSINSQGGKIKITASSDQKSFELKVIEGSATLKNNKGESIVVKKNQVGRLDSNKKLRVENAPLETASLKQTNPTPSKPIKAELRTFKNNSTSSEPIPRAISTQKSSTSVNKIAARPFQPPKPAAPSKAIAKLTELKNPTQPMSTAVPVPPLMPATEMSRNLPKPLTTPAPAMRLTTPPVSAVASVPPSPTVLPSVASPQKISDPKTSAKPESFTLNAANTNTVSAAKTLVPAASPITTPTSAFTASSSPESFTLNAADNIAGSFALKQPSPKPNPKEASTPELPEIIVPLDGAKISFRAELPSVAFRWGEAEHAKFYQLDISSSKDFEADKIILSKQVSDTRYVRIMEAGQFYWRLKALNKGKESDWTIVRSFSVSQAVKTPDIETPVNNQIVEIKPKQSRKVLFKWSKLNDMDNYRLVISKDQSFTDILEQRETAQTQEEVMIPKNGTYHWYLEGRNNKERLAVRTASQTVRVEGDETGSPEENIAAAVDRGRLQIAVIPAMLTYSGSIAGMSSAASGMSFSSFGVNGHFWMWTPFGLSFVYSQTSYSAPASGESFAGGSLQVKELELATLGRYLSSAGLGLIAKLGFAQYTSSQPTPTDETLVSTQLKQASSNNLLLGAQIEKPLTPTFTLTGGADYGIAMATNTGVSKIGMNVELLQRITESRLLIGYGYRYTALSGSTATTETTIPGTHSTSVHGLKLSLGLGF